MFLKIDLSGYGLVVEHVLAKDETGVRFSLAAQKICPFVLILFIKDFSEKCG